MLFGHSKPGISGPGLSGPPVAFDDDSNGGDWGEELTEEQTETLLDKAAAEVHRRRLEVPAVLALEMHKPISTYVGSMAVIFAPFIGPIFGPEAFRDFSRLLLKRDNVERLIQKIEAGPIPPSSLEPPAHKVGGQDADSEMETSST